MKSDLRLKLMVTKGKMWEEAINEEFGTDIHTTDACISDSLPTQLKVTQHCKLTTG